MGVTGKLAAFVKECHRLKSENFDNSVQIPPLLQDKYGGAVEKEWREYLTDKFRYLNLLQEDPKTAIEAWSGEGGRSRRNKFGAFLGEWKRTSKAERLAYLYRISQLDPKTVHTHWYSVEHIEECNKWCQAQQRKLKDIARGLEGSWQDRVVQVYKTIDGRFYTRFHEDYLLALLCKRAIQSLTKRIDQLQAALVKSPVSFNDAGGRLTAECQEVLKDIEQTWRALKPPENAKAVLDANVLGDLSLRLTKALYAVGYDETALIIEFLWAIKEIFSCEVCDFLDTTKDNEMLVWRAATVTQTDLSAKYQKLGPEEFRGRVQKRESYTRGVGITGSILLIPANDGTHNIWTHVGSNNVLRDPRQSRKHRSAYESDMYPGLLKGNKKINNFWAFPVFDGSRFVGAFRVVNKLREDGSRRRRAGAKGRELQPGGWPYLTRVQLGLIAQWFSGFLRAVAPQLESKADFAVMRERTRQIDSLIDRLQLQWIDKGALQAFLRHLTRDISKKQEKHSVGCCILLTQTEAGVRALEHLDPYPLIKVASGEMPAPYDMLDKYHDAVDPLKGAYVFNQKGEFVRILKLQWKEKQIVYFGIDAIAGITRQYNKSVCLLLSRETKNILGYCRGERAVEIFISEGTGEWRFRYPQDILRAIQSHANGVGEDILRGIWNATLEMSYRGLGGIFVVGDTPSEPFQFGLPKFEINPGTKMQSLKETLVEFAKLDGATFVDGNGFITRVNTTVRAVKAPRRTLFPGRGARHEAGETISKLAPKALVIIISENRGISLVHNGNLVRHGGVIMENI